MMTTEAIILREEAIYTKNSIQVIYANLPNPIPVTLGEEQRKRMVHVLRVSIQGEAHYYAL